MKIGLNDLDEYLGLLKALVPVADEVANIAMEFGPVVGTVIQSINDFSVQMNIDNFETYLLKGFSREEALLLCLDTKMAMKSLLTESKANMKVTS
jgi:hypothetical protein